MCSMLSNEDSTELYGNEEEEAAMTTKPLLEWAAAEEVQLMSTVKDYAFFPSALNVDVVDVDVVAVEVDSSVVEWWQGAGCDYNTPALLTHAARTLLPMLDEQLTSDMGGHSHATMCALYMVF